MSWLNNHSIEIFGAISGILYVFLEIRQNIWLWPLGILTSAIYIWVFNNSGFYADMGLQWYYLFISIYGWKVWAGTVRKGESGRVGEHEQREKGVSRLEESRSKELLVSNVKFWQGSFLIIISAALFLMIWFILAGYTDSTIPGWDAFTTALSVVATWMLARKLIEHWYLWMIVNIVSMGLYIYKGLYPTVVLFAVYTIMAFVGLVEWRKVMRIDAN
ncbi:MAG: nicotinamide riboside transporter PnuC [Marinilabiliaceae bacterium]|jgi:nicotinamide mononucleotide transporter|nr:nicotinamide riboside transporter PnuC [Marinilabiliaceae bacterium]